MHFQFSDSEMDENNDSIQHSELSESSDSEPTESELSESEMTEAISGSPMTSQSEMSHRLDSQMDKVTAESDYSSDRMDSRSRSRSNTASISTASDKYRSLSQSQISESQISGTDFTQT